MARAVPAAPAGRAGWRPGLRARLIPLRASRRVRLGDAIACEFENADTLLYQVQEMLRIERIFEAAGINEELDAYNPLIPDGSNWKATFMVEFPEEEERREMLTRLVAASAFMCSLESREVP